MNWLTITRAAGAAFLSGLGGRLGLSVRDGLVYGGAALVVVAFAAGNMAPGHIAQFQVFLAEDYRGGDALPRALLLGTALWGAAWGTPAVAVLSFLARSAAAAVRAALAAPRAEGAADRGDPTHG